MSKFRLGRSSLSGSLPQHDQDPVACRERLQTAVLVIRALHDDRDLFLLARAGDTGARETLIERYLPFAQRLARRFSHTRAEREDLVQVASVALVKAVDRYDPDRGFAFTTFATPTIDGELKRFIRDTRWALRVPRGLQERYLKLETAVAELEPQLGRSPTPAELAQHLRVPREEIIEAYEVATKRDVASLDKAREADDGSPKPAGPPAREDPRYELIEECATIAPLLGNLPDREREILRLRFGGELSQQEIAHQLGISQMHVSRLIRRSLDSLSAAVA
jgi:RNA polymerase sigma-B factor